ncbi:MAG: hypothetical protein FWH25_01790, partial [Syntrophorhabdaceae bacterium]|nr:hypothetical protein [Syntrophorhabdaceae bacterium]
VLYLMHPKAAIDFVKFRERYGNTSILPTKVWFNGLKKPGDRVEFSVNGKPHVIYLVSIGEGIGGVKDVVLSVDNTMHVFQVEMPDSAAIGRKKVRKANPANRGEIGATMNGTVWRIGAKGRTLKEGDFVHKDEELMNIEVMKTENAVKSTINGVISEFCVSINEQIEEGQLLAVIEPENK